MYNEITHVASMYDGKIYSLPKPKRHSDVWVLMVKLGINTSKDIRGFLDEKGNWLTREGAYYRAQRTGQLKVEKEWKDNHNGKLRAGILYSEDIW